MKNFILLTVILFTTVMFSQGSSDSKEHLKFKGVPIDGPLKSFVSKMEQAGFDHIGTEDGIAVMEGEFAGRRNSTIGIITF